MRTAEPQLGAEEESLRKEEPSEREAVSREERSRAAAAESVAMRGESERTEREERERLSAACGLLHPLPPLQRGAEQRQRQLRTA
jgi:hypothetical protein